MTIYFFKYQQLLEDETNATNTHCKRLSRLDAESALNKRQGKTFRKQFLTQDSDTLLWLPVAIGPSGFLLIIIMIVINA